MSRSNEHIHGSRRLHRALGLGLSGVALVGLVYFEGMSARAEAEEADAVEEVEEVEAALELDEVEVDAEAEAENAAKNNVLKANPVALPPSGPAAAPAEPAASPVEGQLALATVAGAGAEAAMPIAPPAPALVAVPDISGMSLRKAKKQLAAVGLKLSVRDEYGDKLPREAWYAFKVGKQRTEAGTEVARGSTVKVKARMRQRYAMGY